MVQFEKSILLVEDSALTRFSSKRALEEKGYIVDEASSGQEALAKVRGKREPYDLVILDIHLPGMDGLKVLENLKFNPDYRYVPVMVVTVDSNLSVVKRAVELGAVDFLCKPYTPDVLVSRVERLIGPGVQGEMTPAALLQKVLRNELNRARRGNLKLALVLARCQSPSREKIAEAGRVARRHLREIDTVIELNKSTLALVLPLTDEKGADVVIKRLGSLLPDPESWSYGKAVYPDSGSDGDELLSRAEATIGACGS
ncbi:MAG: response regulator [Thermacetogeniaceae bacterium]